MPASGIAKNLAPPANSPAWLELISRVQPVSLRCWRMSGWAPMPSTRNWIELGRRSTLRSTRSRAHTWATGLNNAVARAIGSSCRTGQRNCFGRTLTMDLLCFQCPSPGTVSTAQLGTAAYFQPLGCFAGVRKFLGEAPLQRATALLHTGG